MAGGALLLAVVTATDGYLTGAAGAVGVCSAADVLDDTQFLNTSLPKQHRTVTTPNGSTSQTS